MNKLHRFLALLWNMDPGYIQLKRATKTVVAIIISLWITSDHSRNAMLVAAIGSGISMQGIIAKAFWQRIGQLILFDVCYFFAFILGLLVKNSPHLTALTLVFLGFTVNYIRKFNLQKSIAPMMFWLLCFFATILPFSHSMQHWEVLQGLIIGLAVSALVFLLVFPENYCRLFILNANRIFESLAIGLSDLREQLIRKTAPRNFENTLAFQQKELLTHLLESNQAIIDNLNVDDKSPMNQSFLHQYTLISAYEIILDAYQSIWSEKKALPRYLLIAFSIINKNFAKVCQSTRMKKDYCIHIKHPLFSLEKWTDKVNISPLKDPNLIMLLLHLKLGFHLLNKQLTKLLLQKHET
ncbi:hypothetical protein [Legionella israelensis]|uniref:FUSC family protein n=1 Tax=Legionella israelensis TaxID=454 RepID=A0A0W0WK38_9GAMM|nr:hypothetical protein [Legionella israelensis]KTD32696.1 hypothetical protein Lisr_0368 [Legionella israelensis]QBS08981.1 hypothetical protein E4T55_03350 [Legionella israelensis]SCY35554.1 hypothetical protein SAMN02746069_02153 [Legionella israelensis DSM 19235]STX58674.1 Predicted membrane protein [Legionella israelensis]